MHECMVSARRLAESFLCQQALKLGLITPEALQSQRHLSFSGIFAVGDNPAADVRGANAAGAPWTSILVRTG